MVINSKLNWFDYNEIKALLLAHEHCVEKQCVIEEVATLNLTQMKTPSDLKVNSPKVAQANCTNAANDSGNTQTLGQNMIGNFNPRGHGSRGCRDGGRSNTQCQVCHHFGHDASYCYHRFNSAYGPSQPAPYPSGNPFQYICLLLTTLFGHRLQWLEDIRHISPAPRLHL